jgi:hypothetical protein
MHLDAMDLARLAEGRLPESERDRSSQHLAGCPRCAAIYTELVAAHLDPDAQQAAEDDWIRLGLAAGPRRRPALVAVPKRRLNRRLAVVTAVAAVAILAAGTLFVRSRQAGPQRLSADTLALIARWVSEDSYGGLLYSAQLLPAPGNTRGNGQTPEDGTLDEVRRQASLHPDDPDLVFWLISATLSKSQLRASEGTLDDARRRFPKDPRFANLAAIVAFKRNDLPGAERLLRSTLATDRTGVAQANLVRVLRQLGRRSEADSLAAVVRREHPDLAAAANL